MCVRKIYKEIDYLDDNFICYRRLMVVVVLNALCRRNEFFDRMKTMCFDHLITMFKKPSENFSHSPIMVR